MEDQEPKAAAAAAAAPAVPAVNAEWWLEQARARKAQEQAADEKAEAEKSSARRAWWESRKNEVMPPAPDLAAQANAAGIDALKWQKAQHDAPQPAPAPAEFLSDKPAPSFAQRGAAKIGAGVLTSEGIQEQIRRLQSEAKRLRDIEAADDIALVRQLIAKHKMKKGEVFPPRKPASPFAPLTASKKVAPKYVDPKTGATWTGRGHPPKWIDGKDRDQFLIQPAA